MPLKVVELWCERDHSPIGVDDPQPRLSWRLEGDSTQAGFEIRVGTCPQGDDVWSFVYREGLLTSAYIKRYEGKALASSQRVFWQVRVWDKKGEPSEWSQVAEWTMGLLQPEDWQADWIGWGEENAPETIRLKREFSLAELPERAILHITGLGYFEANFNGQPITADLMTPGWTNYQKTVLYSSYDVTGQLKSGDNILEILLGNSMDHCHGPRYTKFNHRLGPQKAIAHLRLEHEKGIEVIATDETWQCAPGPITYSSIYGGEDYDQNLESPPFKPAVKLPEPGGILKGFSNNSPSMRVHETLNAVKLTEIKPVVVVADLGQNASIIPRLQLSGPAGSKVRVIPAELIHPNGTADRGSVAHKAAPAWCEVTLDGRPEFTYEPKFFYHGARYLQIELTPGENQQLPQVHKVEGRVIHADVPAVGEFECSNGLLNRIHKLVRWAQRSNLASVITDCPHRERLGWLEQYHLNGPALMYEHDLSRLYTKCMGDMADAQLENGLVPDIAPEYDIFPGPFRDSPEWGCSIALVPELVDHWYSDKRLRVKYHEQIKKYCDYLTSQTEGFIHPGGLGDWYDIGPEAPGISQLTPISLTATAFYLRVSEVLESSAFILKNQEDWDKYGQLNLAIRQAFYDKFFNDEKGYFASGSQTAQAIACVMKLYPFEARNVKQLAFDQLVRNLEQNDYATTAGDVGYRYVLRALADGGRSDLIFRMINQTAKPGYGYQLEHGATSLTEAWDSHRDHSQNHFMLGQIMEWFYADLAGLKSPAVLKPSPVDGVEWAKASYLSEKGLVESSWHRDGDKVICECAMPGNTGAIFRPQGWKAGVKHLGPGKHKVVLQRDPA